MGEGGRVSTRNFKQNGPKHDFGPDAYAVGVFDPNTFRGDRDWLDAHGELRALHLEKSSTYGTSDDKLANFAAVAAKNGQVPEFYALERIEEKLTRALNMIRAGSGFTVREYLDIAGLALCAEALRRRGFGNVYANCARHQDTEDDL